jgi:hypothetical protein
MAKKPAGRPKYWTKDNLAELKELWTRNTPIVTLQHRFAETDVKSGTSKPKSPFAIQAQIIRLVINDLKNAHDGAAKEKILTIYRIPTHVRQNLEFYADGHWEKDPLEQSKSAEPDLIGEVDEFAEPVVTTPVKKEVEEVEPAIAPPPKKDTSKPNNEPLVQTVEAVNEVVAIQKALLVTDKDAIKLLTEIRDQLKTTNALLAALLAK